MAREGDDGQRAGSRLLQHRGAGDGDGDEADAAGPVEGDAVRQRLLAAAQHVLEQDAPAARVGDLDHLVGVELDLGRRFLGAQQRTDRAS